jgi:pimeloyl-ACP methyl ester carboxylesterase
MKKAFVLGLVLYCSSLYCQEKYIYIDQQKFHIKESGKGDMTVIFENGMSDSLEIWGAIPDTVAKYARVFLYDRADIGKSGLSENERTIPNMVSELRTILQDQNINPPYILVGHSMGGMIIRYYASIYPDEVKGLLLLDPVPESYWKNMSKRELKKYIKGGTEWYETRFPPKYRKEWYYFISNLEYMNNLSIDSKLPVILVSASVWKWYKYHEDILVGLENSRHIELEGEHHIFKDHPDLIIQYINELINNQQ